MSDLQKDFLKAKLSRLPPPTSLFPPLEEDEEAEAEAEGDDIYHHEYDSFPTGGPEFKSKYSDDTASISSASSASSTATVRPLPPKHSSSTGTVVHATSPTSSSFPRPRRSKKNLSPLPWSDYFAEKRSIPITTTTEDGATVTNTFNTYLTPPSGGTLFVTHHGAGSSGLSFAVLTSEILRLDPSCGVLSFDCRGHGETTTTDDNDLRLPTLRADFVAVTSTILAELDAKRGDGKKTDCILVGHSLGGAVVVDAAHSGDLGRAVLGYAVLDVVEGSAVEALGNMTRYLDSRPKGFRDVEQAIDWHIRSHTIRSPESARVSVPALLKPAPEASHPDINYTWHTDLPPTAPLWSTWFTALSKKFLESRGGKLLILAGTDRLDKELMIGQMMGKYQLVVCPEAGHFVHEDEAGRVAGALVEFCKRQAPLVLPPKVGMGVKGT
ncbi:protein phosphatase methylesterase [Ascobolus immersus RN42]|uniref:Protein phosphatase methylesterase 1 n=1 Tax=Ascobolus immersus RN42 TaxID=1160509 RepID=A0A3N4IDJ3_ASCIM|nr:protein phosphatase methylesterase [Ascobolus immersus RN42]